MSDSIARHPITLKRVVHRLPGMDEGRTERDLQYHQSDAGPLALDVYHPHQTDGAPAPVVLFGLGYRDVGVVSPMGCAFKEMEMFISMAQLVASSGMAAVTYTTSEPVADLRRVVDHLDANADALSLDAARIGLWAVSGHVPVALSAIMAQPERFRAAVFSNGYTLDSGGTAIADAAKDYGLVNATAGRTVDDLPANVPLFLVRSGRDEIPGLNGTLDPFVSAAIERNLPVTLVNHPTSPHCFELNEDSALSRHIIGQMLAFMQFHLA